jgi:RimJ/RimL family protein N-acetyltransferase
LIPVLHTNRLTLRGHTPADLDAVAAMWADSVVTHYIGGPLTREDAWARLLRYSGHWTLLGHGFWLIEETATGRYAGDAGFGSLERELHPRFEYPEHGWVLAQWAQGRGYATEAGQAMIAWARSHFGPTPLECLISPENAASLRVADKLGYREYARATYKGHLSVLLRRPSDR